MIKGIEENPSEERPVSPAVSYQEVKVSHFDLQRYDEQPPHGADNRGCGGPALGRHHQGSPRSERQRVLEMWPSVAGLMEQTSIGFLGKKASKTRNL